MKKKGSNYSLRILAIFLAIFAITLYLPNNIITISASESGSPESTDYVENETEIEYVEESESESEMEIIGDIVEIPSFGRENVENQSNVRLSPYVPSSSGGSYIIEDGVYSFENLGNSGLFMDIQQDKYLPGYHMQQYAADGNPATTFDRSCLFKVTRRSTTNSYIIRSMLNNRLTFYFSGNEVLTKEIPPKDADVSDTDTFELVYSASQGCFVIKPYGRPQVIAANNTTASGMAGAPDSYLKKSTEATSGNQARWKMYKYTGESKSGVNVVMSPTATNASLIKNLEYTAKAITWSTEIGKNTPYIKIPSGYTDMANGSWNGSSFTFSFTPTKAGEFKLYWVIRSDGTTTTYKTYYSTYTIVPDIVGDTAFIKNIGTGRYIDIEGPSTAEAKVLEQQDFNGETRSRWIFQLQSNGYFTIKSQYSSKYIGVDSTDNTKVRQYGTKTDYTLWKIVETQAGNYNLVCKAIETSGLVLAVPLNANSNGTNLTMITATADTNYRDEWEIPATVGSLRIDLFVDLAYCDRYTDYSTRIINSMTEIQIKYREYFGVDIQFSAVGLFSSLGDYCDELTGGDYADGCTHAANTSCANSSGFANANKELHHKNIYNMIYRITPPNINVSTKVVFIGHEYCRVSDGQHKSNGLNGLSWRANGVSLITNRSTALDERKTIMHEIGHWFVADLDHYGGTGPSTADKGEGYSRYCIYGEERSSNSVITDLTICDGCKAAIAVNADKFNH